MYNFIKELVKQRLDERKTFDTSNLWISRVGVNDAETQGVRYTQRYVFVGPYKDKSQTYYRIFPSLERINDYSNENSSIFFVEKIKFNSLFPDLKRVTKRQIRIITEDLYSKDQIASKNILEDPEENAKLTLEDSHGVH